MINKKFSTVFALVGTGKRNAPVVLMRKSESSVNADELLTEYLAFLKKLNSSVGEILSDEVPKSQLEKCNLTEKETEVLKYLEAGMQTREIANKLFRSVHTIRNPHKRRMMQQRKIWKQ